MSAILSGLAVSVLKAFFEAFGTSINDFLDRKRAEQAQQELGRTQAERDQGLNTIAAKEAELKAAVEAPKNVQDAIDALRRGEEE